MVHEANIKQANAEKQLKEALGKVTIPVARCPSSALIRGEINCTCTLSLRNSSEHHMHFGIDVPCIEIREWFQRQPETFFPVGLSSV